MNPQAFYIQKYKCIAQIIALLLYIILSRIYIYLALVEYTYGYKGWRKVHTI